MRMVNGVEISALGWSLRMKELVLGVIFSMLALSGRFNCLPFVIVLPFSIVLLVSIVLPFTFVFSIVLRVSFVLRCSIVLLFFSSFSCRFILSSRFKYNV